MSTNINDDVDDRYESNTHYGVFKEGLRIRQPFKDEVTRLVILPAFGDPNDNESWEPYRNAGGPRDDNGNYLFSQWIARYYAHQFVGPKGNQGHFLAEGRTDGTDVLDPVAKLVETARRDYRTYGELTGQGPDGKKSKDPQAFMKVQLPQEDELYAVNAVCLNPAKEEDAGLGCVYSLRSTMVRGKHDVKETGLLYNLRIKNRNVDQIDPADFAKYYYWGDPTDIAGMCPMSVQKISPPKGFSYFNMAPVEGNLVRGTRAMLQSRAFLGDVFNRGVDPAETIEWLAATFSEYPALLKKAFESSFPGIANMLQATGVVSQSRIHQAGLDDDIPGGVTTRPQRQAPADDLPQARGRTTEAPPARREAPADDLPAASGRSFGPKGVPAAEQNAAENLPAAKASVGTTQAINDEADRIRRELEADSGDKAAA